MGQRINLNTAGTHCIGAYVAKPDGKPRGGIVVVQEIFGVTAHIRAVADTYAAHRELREVEAESVASCLARTVLTRASAPSTTWPAGPPGP